MLGVIVKFFVSIYYFYIFLEYVNLLIIGGDDFGLRIEFILVVEVGVVIVIFLLGFVLVLVFCFFFLVFGLVIFCRFVFLFEVFVK